MPVWPLTTSCMLGQHLHGDAGRLSCLHHVGDHLGRGIGYGEEHLLEHVAAASRPGCPGCSRRRGHRRVTCRGPTCRRRTRRPGSARRRGSGASRGRPIAAASRLPTIATRRPLPLEPRCQAKIRDWKRTSLMPTVAKIEARKNNLGVHQLITREPDQLGRGRAGRRRRWQRRGSSGVPLRARRDATCARTTRRCWLQISVTITTISTKSPKCQPYSAGATWRQ